MIEKQIFKLEAAEAEKALLLISSVQKPWILPVLPSSSPVIIPPFHPDLITISVLSGTYIV